MLTAETVIDAYSLERVAQESVRFVREKQVEILANSELLRQSCCVWSSSRIWLRQVMNRVQ